MLLPEKKLWRQEVASESQQSLPLITSPFSFPLSPLLLRFLRNPTGFHGRPSFCIYCRNVQHPLQRPLITAYDEQQKVGIFNCWPCATFRRASTARLSIYSLCSASLSHFARVHYQKLPHSSLSFHFLSFSFSLYVTFSFSFPAFLLSLSVVVARKARSLCVIDSSPASLLHSFPSSSLLPLFFHRRFGTTSITPLVIQHGCAGSLRWR